MTCMQFHWSDPYLNRPIRVRDIEAFINVGFSIATTIGIVKASAITVIVVAPIEECAIIKGWVLCTRPMVYPAMKASPAPVVSNENYLIL